MKKKLSSNRAELIDPNRAEILYQKVFAYIDNARQVVQRSIDLNMIKAYWLIGHDIVEEEQHGFERAEYGQAVLLNLSMKLRQRYQKGFSVDTLENIRNFYLTSQEVTSLTNSESVIRNLAKGKGEEKSEALLRKSEIPAFPHNLSWTHYIHLMKLKRPEARKFYEVEASKNNWSSRELSRQIGSLLYDRLSNSKKQYLNHEEKNMRNKNKIDPHHAQLDDEENELLESFEQDEWKPVKNPGKGLAAAKKAAANYLKKNARINIRISENDLAKLKQKAAFEGIPYQTLIASILHKYAAGHINKD